MASYSPNEFLYARPLANAILNDIGFREWFFVGTKLAKIAVDLRALPEDQARLRTTPQSRKWFWFNYFCPKDSLCSCKIGTGIETDILIILEGSNGRRYAVHVEVKLPNEHLGPGQAQSYPRRARCWANPATRPRTVPAHDEFVTILACGDDMKSDECLSHFDKVAFHSDIEQRISLYPDSTDRRLIEAVSGQPAPRMD